MQKLKNIYVINVNEFDYSAIRNIKLQYRKRGNQATNKKYYYKDNVYAFDIETTSLDNGHSIMYIWQFAYGEHNVVIGRTWEEFLRFTYNLSKQLSYDERIVVYIHNAAFEFYFLKGVYEFTQEDIFALNKKKIAKFFMYDKKIEYRCSYIHSNMSLSVYTDKWGVETPKTFMDYKIKRYPWTDLTPDELYYCCADVCGLVQALNREMEFDGDDLYTVPMTSTGYVRRDAKIAMRSVNYNWLKDQLPDWETYKLARECARGGNVHANRFYVGEIMDDVECYDRKSSYPDVQINDMFPVSKFVKDTPSMDRVIELLNFKYALMFRVTFKNIELINKFWGCPYLTKDKGSNIINGRYDNGRILSATQYTCSLTDIDFRIVLEEYNFDPPEVHLLMKARYGKLPDPLLNVIRDYFVKKEELDGIEEMILYYMKSKNKLNAVFGMAFTNPVRDNYVYNILDKDLKLDDSVTDQVKLIRYNKTAFLNYLWGVWTTALARWRLEEAIKKAHEPGNIFIYCDTDSVYYKGKIDWTSYNAERIANSRKNKGYAKNANGKRVYLGVYEEDGFCKKFVTLGCKKYCKIDKGGELKITVAGVRKKDEIDETGKVWRKGGATELGCIENFKPGFIFKESAGNLVTYNNVDKPFTYKIGDHELLITSNITLSDNTYTLKCKPEYEECIADSKRLLKNLLISKGEYYEND